MNEDNFVSDDVEYLFREGAASVLEKIISCMYCGIAISRTGKDGFVIWNEVAKKTLGKPQADISGEKWAEHYGVHYPDAPDKIMATEDLPLVKALSGKEVKDSVLFIKNEAQSGAWISCSAKPILKSGEIIGGVCVWQDITNEILMEIHTKELLAKIEELKQVQEKIINKTT